MIYGIKLERMQKTEVKYFADIKKTPEFTPILFSKLSTLKNNELHLQRLI